MGEIVARFLGREQDQRAHFLCLRPFRRSTCASVPNMVAMEKQVSPGNTQAAFPSRWSMNQSMPTPARTLPIHPPMWAKQQPDSSSSTSVLHTTAQSSVSTNLQKPLCKLSSSSCQPVQDLAFCLPEHFLSLGSTLRFGKA